MLSQQDHDSVDEGHIAPAASRFRYKLGQFSPAYLCQGGEALEESAQPLYVRRPVPCYPHLHHHNCQVAQVLHMMTPRAVGTHIS